MSMNCFKSSGKSSRAKVDSEVHDRSTQMSLTIGELWLIISHTVLQGRTEFRSEVSHGSLRGWESPVPCFSVCSAT